MKKNLNIAKNVKIWFGISLVLITISLGSLLIQGLNFGIDFIGGTIISIELHTPFENADARAIVDKFDPSADVTYAGDAQTEVVITTKKSFTTEERQALFSGFQDKYSLQNTDLISVDTVNASIGAEAATNAVKAVVVAVALMLIYITFRFELISGITAIMALVHDLIVVVGVYSVFQIQVNSPFIAAILTILGYSIMDTVVVFDRIRENRPKFGKYAYGELLDASVTQTMRRSIFTSVATFVAITSLYIFGVPAIQNFALPLMVGVVIGTYSSIFNAGALWYVIKTYQHKKSLKTSGTKV
ncbi:protein translocase subunit SecF [Acetobacterium paludosum]|uniref:Protein-export membrane protein SecF n=1 Tax=Acetobacterium paludosum TaxID=52693 RepID=A0A923I221_9FIRM|nr:protein translocase subunit SecF [Acetobacterium paludosum]MBC3887655.1 protein translocase subunit SecF [Acetobacterium paludosum]